MAQEDPVSPTIFNIVVNAVVRAVMMEVFGPQESYRGFGWAEGEHNIVFYAGGGCIAGRKTIWCKLH